MTKRYHAVLLGLKDRPDAPWSTVAAEDDVDALAQVRRLLGPSSAYDLYQGSRLVHRHRWPDPDRLPHALDQPGLTADDAR